MSLNQQFLLRVAVVVIALWGGLSILALKLGGDRVEQALLDRLSREVAVAASTVEAPFADGTPSRIARVLSENLKVRATLIGQDGWLLADSSLSESRWREVGFHGDREEIQQAFRSGEGRSKRRSASNGVEYHYVARKVTAPGAIAYVRLALPESEVSDARGAILVPMLLFSLLALAAALLLSWMFVRRLLKPVSAVAASASEVVLGRHDRPLSVEGPEEVVELARTVDQMRSALVEQVERLGAEQTLLRTMVDGLEEGLLLVDPERRVLLLNHSLLELLRIESLGRDQRVGEVIRHPVVIERVVQCLAEGKEQRATLKGLGGTNRSFELHVVSVALPGESSRRGALALFFDITRLEALERVRQQFIADVSHELRTPVTSIKGALETLVESLDTLGPTDRKFLDMACRQADRMSELISDLTDLSRIETGAITLQPRSILLKDLVRVVVETVMTRRKTIAAEISIRVEESISVYADSRRLEQVLLNLVDNAVKFSGPGSHVEVVAELAPKCVRIMVDDSGPGIPEEHREQVFTRFFRVDKGRTREAGGTGLGLAIVKHLVKLHRGAVWVEKGPLGGARFVVELPRQ